MKRGHRACSLPFGLGYGYVAVQTEWVPPVLAIGGVALVLAFCTFPDYDHPRFRGKRNPIAAFVRNSAKLLYLIRTEYDREREDQHRGPSHCIEYNLALGGFVAAPLLILGLPAAPVWFVGGAVALGGVSHILGDLMTPSGVPLSVLYNVLAYRGKQRQVWRRHALGWFVTDTAGERVGAIPVLYLTTAVLALAMIGGLDDLWRVTTGDVFDGRWVILAILVAIAYGVGGIAARLVIGAAGLLAEVGLVAGRFAVITVSAVVFNALSIALGIALVLAPVALFAPQWLPW